VCARNPTSNMSGMRIAVQQASGGCTGTAKRTSAGSRRFEKGMEAENRWSKTKKRSPSSPESQLSCRISQLSRRKIQIHIAHTATTELSHVLLHLSTVGCVILMFFQFSAVDLEWTWLAFYVDL
jgi:hypothetical protein